MSWETLAPKRTEAGDAAANGPDIDEADREFLELADGRTSLRTILLVLGIADVHLLRMARRLLVRDLVSGLEAIAPRLRSKTG